MPYEDLLGRVATLTVRRFGSPGAFLALDATDSRPDAAVLLLPGAEVPETTRVGDALEVFVYLDSEDRPVATRRTPKLTLGQVAFLEVTDTTHFGAFVDIGLLKDLLVPLAEQTCEMHLGQRYAVGLMLDRSGRLCGTLRVAEMLGDTRTFTWGQWVEGEAWRREPGLGVFVIIERQALGLLPEQEPHQLKRGDVGRFRVAQLLPDGKIELSLRALAHEELENDAARVLEALRADPELRVNDASGPEEIRALFGLSKKAFKRGVGRLLKNGLLTFGPDGFLVAPPARPWEPQDRLGAAPKSDLAKNAHNAFVKTTARRVGG